MLLLAVAVDLLLRSIRERHEPAGTTVMQRLITEGKLVIPAARAELIIW